MTKIHGNGSYCKFCQKYYTGQCGLPKGSDGTFILKPFNKWKKATGSSSKNNKLLKHQESKSHRVAVAQADMCSNIVEKKGSVFSCRKGESRKFENTQQNIKFVYWLMKNEVAHSTHYQSLIDLCTDFDESGVVATWQKNRGDNATYRSSAIST